MKKKYFQFLKKRGLYICFFFSVFVLSLSGWETEKEKDKTWHLLELGKLQMEKGEFGEALHYANLARDVHKRQIEKKYEYMFKALKPKQVKHAGDNIFEVYSVLKEREDYDACEILDEIFLNHPPVFFDKSISKLMSWLEKKDSFPETDFLTGQIYSAEGEYGQALHYFKNAWDYRLFLEIPDARFDIIYALADTSRLLRKYDEQEKYLLLVLTEDPVYGTTSLESATLKAMVRTLTAENSSEKFFLLYRHHNSIALKAYIDLTDIYLQAGNKERALTVAALAASIAVTDLDDAVSKVDFNYGYKNIQDLLHKLNRRQEILKWAETRNFWKAILNLADSLAVNNYKRQASDLYQKMAESIPSIKYAQEAAYKKAKLNNTVN
ncbi:hypothetical protein [Treponema pedis]|uniref:TPR domain-containing protein n=1 Tax=Treponema pedis str. T A4 TaxID=1291379 RepID=S6A4S4_9SPIR|nr:hypothetical protein [Treponema pedis]AGT44721.1 TPR domain-containing protein [Treponema pedis str. T A4]